MKIALGIDVGMDTGVACVGFFETSKKVIVLARETIQDRKMIGGINNILHRYEMRHHPDYILVELPIISRQMTTNAEQLEAIVHRLKEALRDKKNVLYILPGQWKQTPSADFVDFIGIKLSTRHEYDAARLCHWGFVYSGYFR